MIWACLETKKLVSCTQHSIVLYTIIYYYIIILLFIILYYNIIIILFIIFFVLSGTPFPDHKNQQGLKTSVREAKDLGIGVGWVDKTAAK